MLTEKEKGLLKQVVDHFDKEDTATRYRQIRMWRKLKFLWDNLQHTYFSEIAHDWRVPDSQNVSDDQAYYDKPVNIFRALLESIIAALSVNTPAITCYPDDATDELDLATAEAGDKIAQLIYRHNDVPLLWLHSLFIFCTEGMLAAYSYPDTKNEFGTYEEPKYEEVTTLVTTQTCPECKAVLGDGTLPEGEQDTCPACGAVVTPFTETDNSIENVQIGTELKAKTRVILDVYGGLYVKVPAYARKQSDCPYLIWSYETHYSNVLEKYPELRGKFDAGGSATDTYEKWGRLSPQYKGEYPQNNVTVRNAWLRPSAFNVLKEDETELLKKKYPTGAKVVLVNDNVAEADEEALDDYWTLSYNPLADYIHFDPIGLLLVSVQEIFNDLVSLTVQTVEHGIPQTFADPRALDFQAYKDQEVIPGGVYPAKMQPGRPLSDSFHEVKTATLSGEVLPFTQKVQEAGQLVSGALPSLFGGSQAAGSRTAAEYSMSRAQALQRLQNPWKILTIWWKNIFGKAIPMFIRNMQTDERMVDKNKLGGFINTFIRKVETLGKIGRVELEASDQIPLTWIQQKEAIMELFKLNNDKVLEALASPENIPYLKRAFGLPDYEIPGEDDRAKQYEEITQLVNSEPISIPGGMTVAGEVIPDQQFPSVEVDPDIDNHAIEGEICRSWLISAVGRQTKLDNKLGYLNVLLHYKQHKDAMAAAMVPPDGMVPPQPTNEEQPSKQEVDYGE